LFDSSQRRRSLLTLECNGNEVYIKDKK
jgi:hypothetical protein